MAGRGSENLFQYLSRYDPPIVLDLGWLTEPQVPVFPPGQVPPLTDESAPFWPHQPRWLDWLAEIDNPALPAIEPNVATSEYFPTPDLEGPAVDAWLELPQVPIFLDPVAVQPDQAVPLQEVVVPYDPAGMEWFALVEIPAQPATPGNVAPVGYVPLFDLVAPPMGGWFSVPELPVYPLPPTPVPEYGTPLLDYVPPAYDPAVMDWFIDPEVPMLAAPPRRQPDVALGAPVEGHFETIETLRRRVERLENQIDILWTLRTPM